MKKFMKKRIRENNNGDRGNGKRNEKSNGRKWKNK